MSTKQKSNQSGPGSKIDQRKKEKANRDKEIDNNNEELDIEDVEAIDDDFLSGDNKKKTYPNNHNNPTPDYNKKTTAPTPGSNPNIGGDESEYENSTPEEELYDEEITSNDDYQDDDNTKDEEERYDPRDDIDRYLEF